MEKKVFTPAPLGSSQNEAMAGGEYSAVSRAYILGYYKAANVLMDAAINGRGRDKDILFFPIVFNYRHHIELSLKYLINFSEKSYRVFKEVEATRGELKEIPESQKLTHNLETLINILKERLALISEEGLKENIRKNILEINQIDPNGETFRYELNRQKQLTIPELKRYDLKNIQEQMEEVHNYLEAIGTWLQVETDLALEYLFLQQEQIAEFETYLEIQDFESSFY